MKESKVIFLNSISNLIDQISRQLIALILNPIIINGLGTYIYGIWRMISQTTNYSNVVDMQTSQTLFWTISKERTIKTENFIRQEVSNAFFVTSLLMPFFLIIGGIILYYIPKITKVDYNYVLIVRITTLILLTTFLFNKYFTLFDSLLKGMNLSYKRMGVKAGISFINALLVILALKLNFGIIGIAFAELFTVIILIILLINILNKNVPFFKLIKPDRYGCKRYFKKTFSFFLFSIIKTLSNNSDLLIIGYFINPNMVSIYVTTRYLIVATKTLSISFIQASKPTFSSYIGENNFIKASKIREQIFDLIWITLIPLSFTLIVLNESFINIWIGNELFAGKFENILIIVYFVLSVFLYNDEGYIKSSLNLKKITIFTAITTIFFLALSVFLIKEIGLKGFLFAQIGLNLTLIIIYQSLLKNIFGKSFVYNHYKIFRFIFSALILFSLGYLLNIGFVNGIMKFTLTFFMFFLIGIITIFLIFNKKEKKAIYSLIGDIFSKTKK